MTDQLTQDLAKLNACFEELLWGHDDDLLFTHDGEKVIIINKTRELEKNNWIWLNRGRFTPIFMSEKFYVYSKDGCGFCDKLTQFMESKGVLFEKFTLDTDFSKEEFIDKFGYNSSFPQVYYKNDKVGGMKDTVRYLHHHDIVWRRTKPLRLSSRNKRSPKHSLFMTVKYNSDSSVMSFVWVWM